MSVIGLGFDATDIPRIRETYERYGDRFLQRVYTAEEIAYCIRQRDPVPSLAARFAAKEAAMKALGTGWGAKANWINIEVVRARGGRPEIALHGHTADFARELGIRRMLVSITHTDANALAYVIAQDD